jgi:hypothetical protein
MKKILSILFIAMIGFIACKDKKQVSGKDTQEPSKAEVAQNPAADSVEIREVITSFYNWYNKNYAKFQVYNLYSSIKKKGAPPYKINWSEVTKYQDFIRASVPQLGEEFISNQKRFFQQCDSAFKVDVEDDIPYGFDYDWYTNSQEDAQYTIDEMNKAKQWIIKVNGDDATAEVKGTYDDNGKQTETTFMRLALKKENGQWKIAKIGNE